MPTATLPLPLTDTIEPTDQVEVATTLRDAFAAETPIYPLGGRTALGFGMTAKRPGLGLSTTGLTKVIDYPARDMTITVEAGMTLAELAKTLATENQYLPLDVAQPATATVGGVMAVNFSGPRRYGYGTFRDYIIGVSAVDGTGTSFKAGGRVVKNVAGYDFCKLLTGSLGTLAVVTQATLKVRPRPTASVVVVYEAATFDAAEALLAALTTTRTTPVAVELLAGEGWRGTQAFASSASSVLAVVGFEGTGAEVEWLVAQLQREWEPLGAKRLQTLADAEAAAAYKSLTEFGCGDGGSLILKLNVPPSRVIGLASHIARLLPKATTLAHAGSGIVLVDAGEISSNDAAKLLIRELRPAAAAAGGQAVVWNCASPEEWTPQAYWGPSRDDDAVMRAVKRQFDPKAILSPGRFNL